MLDFDNSVFALVMRIVDDRLRFDAALGLSRRFNILCYALVC